LVYEKYSVTNPEGHLKMKSIYAEDPWKPQHPFQLPSFCHRWIKPTFFREKM